MSQPDALSDYASFCAEVAAKLRKGQRTFGDASFSVSSLALVREVKEELIDINGWSYVLFQRLKKLESELSRLETEAMCDQE